MRLSTITSGDSAGGLSPFCEGVMSQDFDSLFEQTTLSAWRGEGTFELFPKLPTARSGNSEMPRAYKCSPFMSGTVAMGCYIGKVTSLITVMTGALP